MRDFANAGEFGFPTLISYFPSLSTRLRISPRYSSRGFKSRTAPGRVVRLRFTASLTMAVHPTAGGSSRAGRLGFLHVLPMLLALWISSAALVSGATELPPATPYQVSPSCPCLSQSEVIARVRESVADDDTIKDFCPDGLLPATVGKGAVPGVQCLPAALGSDICRAWDAALDPVRSRSPHAM